jgi:hypothetical protein
MRRRLARRQVLMLALVLLGFCWWCLGVAWSFFFWSNEITTTTNYNNSNITLQDTDTKTPILEQPLAIVVGLPKSGTTTLYHFFTCSGYSRTTHYCCCGSNATEYPCTGGRQWSHQLQDNLAQGHPLLWHGTGTGSGTTGGGGAAAAATRTRTGITNTDNRQDHHHPGGGGGVIHAQLDGETSTGYFLPQQYLLQELDQAAPKAIWILPLRPPDQWKSSVQHWLDMEDRLRKEYQQQQQQQQQQEDYYPYDDYSPTNNNHNNASSFDLRDFYQWHTHTIRAYCRQYRTPDKCIEVTLDDPEAGLRLAERFPGTRAACWGRHNAGPFFQAFPSAPTAASKQLHP